MGTTKHLDFDLETKAIAEICKALGHPTRMQIMTLLWTKNNRTCGEIVSQIPLAQSTISKHLLELKKANLLNVKNIGKKTIYSIQVEKIQILKRYLIVYLSNKSLSKLDELMIAPAATKIIKKDKTYLKEFNYQFSHKETEKIEPVDL